MTFQPVPPDPPAARGAGLTRRAAVEWAPPELDTDRAWRMAADFLLGYRGQTRRAYFADIRAWYAALMADDPAQCTCPRDSRGRTRARVQSGAGIGRQTGR